MNSFQPTPGTLTELSIACIECVFLIYLLTLKQKSRDCYLIIAIYITAVIFQTNAFIFDSSVDPSGMAWFRYNTLKSVALLSIIWCSYRFHKNPFPTECWIVMLLFTALFGIAIYLIVQDVALYQYPALSHNIFFNAISAMATLLSCTNYIRKISIFLNPEVRKNIIHELLSPSTKITGVFGGFALSLLLYTIVWLSVILLHLNLIRTTTFYFLIYPLSVSITVLVGFVYFNYASERTSFQTKLLGICLFLTLSVLSMTPITLFALTGVNSSDAYIRVFVVMIPVSTLLISLLLPVLFRITILKHFNKVLAGVRSVKSGDLSANIEIEVNDEIGRLSEDFNQMTQALRERTDELHNMRENIAIDFHDQTGNMLSAITRQAGLLKLILNTDHKAQPMVESIINNSENLYESSKDFLWHLNHESDNPIVLFEYLKAYGQQYYNQFDIAFSANAEVHDKVLFQSSAAINLIYIFKEAMTNVVKHAGADEVQLDIKYQLDSVEFILKDNGSWKEMESGCKHYGLSNMERRCLKNDFKFSLIKDLKATSVSICVPVQYLK